MKLSVAIKKKLSFSYGTFGKKVIIFVSILNEEKVAEKF